MKVLKNAIELNSQVKIYVPSTVDVDIVADTKKWIDDSLTLLSKCFGGSTATNALGAWITATGKLVKEDVVICFSYAKEADLEASINEIYGFCLRMKLELKQEMIALEVNGRLYLI